jgi:hypothetical protein
MGGPGGTLLANPDRHFKPGWNVSVDTLTATWLHGVCYTIAVDRPRTELLT